MTNSVGPHFLPSSKRKFIWQKSRINDQLLRDLPHDVERSFLSSNCVPWETRTHFLRSKAYELNNMILAIIFKETNEIPKIKIYPMFRIESYRWRFMPRGKL